MFQNTAMDSNDTLRGRSKMKTNTLLDIEILWLCFPKVVRDSVLKEGRESGVSSRDKLMCIVNLCNHSKEKDMRADIGYELVKLITSSTNIKVFTSLFKTVPIGRAE